MASYCKNLNDAEPLTKQVWCVRDFARRNELGSIEEKKILKLLGSFASQHELLINARRPVHFR